MQVGFGVGHAGVAVAEHLDLVEADDRGRGRQLALPHLRHERPFGSGIEAVEGLALLASDGFCRSPSSPPVQHTSTVWTPSAPYFATVGAPFDASSSGCACTVNRASRPAGPLVSWSVTCSVTRRRLSATVECGLYARSVRRLPFVLATSPSCPSLRATRATANSSARWIPIPRPRRPRRPRSTPGPCHRFRSTTAVDGAQVAAEPGAAGFRLFAPWAEGAPIDARYTCDGDDISPAISWSGPPAGTIELAFSLVDESAASGGEPLVHWVIAGVDPADVSLIEGQVPLGAVQATNSFNTAGWTGPCPPPGEPAHVYRLTMYALSQQSELADGSAAQEMLDYVAEISAGSTELTGTYQR